MQLPYKRQLIERVTKEAKDDGVWYPYPMQVCCWHDLNTDSEFWVFFPLAPFIWLWKYLEVTDWSKRNATAGEMRLRGTPISNQEFLWFAKEDAQWELYGRHLEFNRYLLSQIKL